MSLAVNTYQQTSQLPKEELFGLTSQMRRASASIPMNIAEGFGKHTRPEFLRGLRLATGSLFELMTAYELAEQLELLRRDQQTLDLMAETDRLISALIRSLERKAKG